MPGASEKINRNPVLASERGPVCFLKPHAAMVGVAQLAERQVVVLDVEGSSPFAHPKQRYPRSLVFGGMRWPMAGPPCSAFSASLGLVQIVEFVAERGPGEQRVAGFGLPR